MRNGLAAPLQESVGEGVAVGGCCRRCGRGTLEGQRGLSKALACCEAPPSWRRGEGAEREACGSAQGAGRGRAGKRAVVLREHCRHDKRGEGGGAGDG